MPLLQLTAVKKEFKGPDGGRHLIVDVATFNLEPARQIGLAGESGSGKTTFLHLIAGISKPTAGSIVVAGKDMASLGESERDRWRALNIGYVFQTFNLLPAFTCLENVLLGMSFGIGRDRSAAIQLLQRVGLGNKLHHYPRQLSTGQQQRVAVARALANRPKLILADEPTGNLDERNGREVLALILETSRENNAALLLVSHDRQMLGQFETVVDFRTINQAQATVEARP